MDNDKLYTTQLSAGQGMIDESRMLLDLWQPDMKSSELYQTALDSGYFPNVSARRLRNIVAECFAPRFLVKKNYPAAVLKNLKNCLSSTELAQLFFLFTARANPILADFMRGVYWAKYASGQDSISNEDAKNFVVEANQNSKTIRYWSERTIQRMAGYLTGCCADFGMLEKGRCQVSVSLFNFFFSIRVNGVIFRRYPDILDAFYVKGLEDLGFVIHSDEIPEALKISQAVGVGQVSVLLVMPGGVIKLDLLLKMDGLFEQVKRIQMR